MEGVRTIPEEQPVVHTPKKDRYARARGASQFWDLWCVSCQHHLALYQKDGPGALLRLYLDRIFAPLPQSNWQKKSDLKDVPALKCANCGTLIAVAMIYRPERRLALRLIPGTFTKVRSNGTYPPAQKPNQK